MSLKLSLEHKQLLFETLNLNEAKRDKEEKQKTDL